MNTSDSAMQDCAKGPSPPLQVSPADCVVCGLALSISSLALLNSHLGFLIGCIGTPFALVWIGRLIRDRKRRTWGLRAMAYGSSIALLIAGPAGCQVHTLRTETALQPLIEALEQHRAQTGSYPEKLTALKSQPYSGCRGTGTGDSRAAYYSTRSAQEQFRLTCVTFGMNKHTYESETRRWRDWD